MQWYVRQTATAVGRADEIYDQFVFNTIQLITLIDTIDPFNGWALLWFTTTGGSLDGFGVWWLARDPISPCNRVGMMSDGSRVSQSYLTERSILHELIAKDLWVIYLWGCSNSFQGPFKWSVVHMCESPCLMSEFLWVTYKLSTYAIGGFCPFNAFLFLWFHHDNAKSKYYGSRFARVLRLLYILRSGESDYHKL